MTAPLDFACLMGDRIRLARQEAGLSQETLSTQLGFNDRQTLSTIESGKRAVSAEELVLLTKLLGQPVDFFTDPYLLVEQGEFSYRTVSAAGELKTFEATARRLLSANHRFRLMLDEPPSPVVGQLRNFTTQATPSQANTMGNQLSRAWALGGKPAEKLGDMLESKLHVMVLYVDAPAGVSGAACRLTEGDAVLINRNEPAYRQNWTLAHELFHLLTWDHMPPEKIDREQLKEAEKPKPEKLADAFTAGLLMPFAETRTLWERTPGEVHQRILKCADHFQVSGQALFYRLKILGLIDATEAAKVELTKLARKKDPVAGRPLYSQEFVRRLHGVLERGLVTVRLACDLLDTDMAGLKALFKEHGLGVPFDL